MVVIGDGEEDWHVGNGFGKEEEKKWRFFQSYTDYKAQNAQVINALGKQKFRAHYSRLLKYPNGQIVDKCSMKLQTKFR